MFEPSANHRQGVADTLHAHTGCTNAKAEAAAKAMVDGVFMQAEAQTAEPAVRAPTSH